MTTQLNLEMRPVVMPALPEDLRIFRQYQISDDAINMIEQIHMVSRVRKSDIVDDAVKILATLIKCSKQAGFRIEDVMDLTDVLESYVSIDDFRQ